MKPGPEQQFDVDQLAMMAACRTPTRGNSLPPEEAFRLLYDQCAPRLVPFLASRLRRHDLDDAHQAIWQKVWQSLPTQFSGGNFKAWLFQIARNHLVDMSRKRKAGQIDHEQHLVDHHAAPGDQQLLLREEQEILRRCLDSLDQTATALVRLRLAGEAYQEICRELHLEAARAHKIFHNAKSQLQDCVQRSL